MFDARSYHLESDSGRSHIVFKELSRLLLLLMMMMVMVMMLLLLPAGGSRVSSGRQRTGGKSSGP